MPTLTRTYAAEVPSSCRRGRTTLSWASHWASFNALTGWRPMHRMCGDLAKHRAYPRHARSAPPAAPFSGWVIITVSFVAAIPSAAIAEPDFWPSGKQWREAALGAVTDPHTWIPAAGAAATGLTGLDDTIADWA